MAYVLVPGNEFEVFGQRFKVIDMNQAKGDILCITSRPWRKASFDDATSLDCINDFNYASVRKMLRYTFFASLVETEDDYDLFVEMKVEIRDNSGLHRYDHLRDRVRLLTQQEVVKYQAQLNILDWAWTMTPFKCKERFRKRGDQSVAIADSTGRWGHKRANEIADVYPVVTFKQRIAQHSTFIKK